MEEEILRSSEALLEALRDQDRRCEVATSLLVTSISSHVQETRKNRGLTQTELAELTGTRQPKISEIENGESGGVNWETSTLLGLAHALQVRLKISLETFGSLSIYSWAPPPLPEADPSLQVPSDSSDAERLRAQLQNREFREAYVETAVYADLAAQVQALRRQRGLTQNELSSRAKLPQKTLSNVENPIDGPSAANWVLGTLLKIATALDVRLQVDFLPYGTLLADLMLTSDTLRRPEPRYDPLLFIQPSMPVPDAKAPERTRWMQELVIPWLYQDSHLAIDQLVRWLQGKDLPPVGYEEEPYRWILRGIPSQLQRPHFDTRLAERLAVILSYAPDEAHVVSDQDDDFLSGLYWTCAGVNCPGILAEPLWDAYKRLRVTRPSGPVRDALQAAIVHNQFGDKAFKEIWKPMIETGRHHLLRGSEVLGYEGLLAIRTGPSRMDDILWALAEVVRRWDGDEEDISTLRRLLKRTELTRSESPHLWKRAQNWPAWARHALSIPEIVRDEQGDQHRIVVTVELSLGQLQASWQLGEPAEFQWNERIEHTTFAPSRPRAFYNAVLDKIRDYEPMAAYAAYAHPMAFQAFFSSPV